MGRRRMHAAFILYKTLGYPELRYIMYKEGVLQDVTASRLAELLEGDKDHSVRGRLHDYPDDSGIRDCVTDIIRCL